MLQHFATNRFLKHLETIEHGALKLITPDGKSYDFGGKDGSKPVTLTLHEWSVVANLITKGDVGFAEDYRDGNWDTDNLEGVVALGLENQHTFRGYLSGSKLSRILSSLLYFSRINTVQNSRKNIHAHYDLGNEFYGLWLDPSMTYSSAIYDDAQDLLSAQHKKYDRILDRLGNNSGHVLEIGCGWGGFADRAVSQGDYDIKAITLSKAQHKYTKERLNGNANIALEDYRHQTGTFDNIVSIEMFEAVGEKFWSTYFEKLASLLKKKGTAVIQTITINENTFQNYRKGNDFIRSYIFPGGMLPSISRFKNEAEKAGLRLNDTFNFGKDYARTLREWHQNFDLKIDNVKALGFDDKFIRLWRFYLAACAAGFETGHTDVIQAELGL